ncbi:MAG: hypothetical protein ACP5U1_17130 [Desulfomonilaceae bacterium]
MDQSTIRLYDENSEKLAELFEAVDMSTVHRLLLRFLLKNASAPRIGCGSGDEIETIISRAQKEATYKQESVRKDLNDRRLL